MHTADLLELAVATVESLGYKSRWEWLGDNGGGGCEIRGQKWLFIDLAQDPAMQLATVLEVLAHEARMRKVALPEALERLARTDARKAA